MMTTQRPPRINNHHDDCSSCQSSSSLSEDETQKLINSIRQIAPSAEIEISDDYGHYRHNNQDDEHRSPSPNDQPIIDITDVDQHQISDLEQYEKDKKSVYSHPLFPLLELLLRRCEYATATLNSNYNNHIFNNNSNTATTSTNNNKSSPPPPPTAQQQPPTSSAVASSASLLSTNHNHSAHIMHEYHSSSSSTSSNPSNSAAATNLNNSPPHTSPVAISAADQNSSKSTLSLHKEVELFLLQLRKDGRPFMLEEPEVDNVVLTAIQVLRIHLLELEKVQDLCKDFCQRYITCLKTKMSSENLLRGTTGLMAGAGGVSFDESCESSDENSTGPPPPPFGRSNQARRLPSDMDGGQQNDVNNSLVAGLALAAAEAAAARDSGNEGDLSDDASAAGAAEGRGTHHRVKHHTSQQQKRGILPKQATSIMRTWLFQHIVHPYPTEDEKRTIAAQTSLTMLQVNNWFINARRRILQPMLDSANSLATSAGGGSENATKTAADGGSKHGSSSKKIKTRDTSAAAVVTGSAGGSSGGHVGASMLPGGSQNRSPPVQRFWSDSLNNIIQAGGGNSRKD